MYDDLPSFLKSLGYYDGDSDWRLLQTAVEQANDAYNRDSPILDESEYNNLMIMTNAMEVKHNHTLTSDCSEVTEDKTLKPMYSLNKVYDTAKLVKFLTKFESDDKVLIEPKLDGVSLVVCYREGTFSHIQLKTRTFNAEQAKCLPIKNIAEIINATTSLSSVDIRGEVVIELDKFDGYVDSFSNARTMVSSMLNTKDASTLGYPSNLFDFIVFEVMPAIEIPSAFEVIDYVEHSVKSAISLIEEDDITGIYKEVIPYLLDGIVFKVPAYEHLGYTKRFPRNHMALKYMSENVLAKVVNIHIDETEKGIRQSVRISIEPTGIGGVVVRTINLGSVKILESLSIKIGDYIKFTLSGGIVPVVLEVISTD